VHRQKRGDFDDEIESMGGRIYRMCPLYPQYFIKYKRKLKAFFKEHREYKIIHSHMSELGYFALREAKKQNVPVRIAHAHSAPSFGNLGLKEQIKKIVREYFRKNIVAVSTHLFTCSYSSAIWLYGEKNKNRFVMMNNAVDAAKFKFNTEVREIIRDKLNIRNKLVVGHVGRFSETKNHSFLIDIFNEIQHLQPESILLLLGEGELKEKIQNKVKKYGIENKVLFLGKRDDVNELLQAMDILIFPSFFEGLSVTLIESQAAGIPCLVSKEGITPQTKITDCLHFLSLEENSEIWAAKAIRLACLGHKDTFDEIMRNNWDIHANAQWLTDFYVNCDQENERGKL
jgi:glycosyltransferase involved in cell wall biosynthesis